MSSHFQPCCNCGTLRTRCCVHAQKSKVFSQYSRGQGGLYSCAQTESESNQTAVICSNNSLGLTHNHDHTFRTCCSPSGLNMVNGYLPGTPCSQPPLWECSSWLSESCPCMAITRNNICLNCPRRLLRDPSGTWHQRYKPCRVQTQIFYPQRNLSSKVDTATAGEHLSKDKGCGVTSFYSERYCSSTGRKEAGTLDSYGSTIDHCGLRKKLACPLLHPSSRNSSATFDDEYRGHQKNFVRHGAGAISKESQASGQEAQANDKTIDLDEFWRKYMSQIFQMKNKAGKMSRMWMGTARGEDHETGAPSGGRCKQCSRHHAKRVPGMKWLRSHQSVIAVTEDTAVSASCAAPHSTEGQAQNSLTIPQAQRSFRDSFNATKPVPRKLLKHDKSM